MWCARSWARGADMGATTQLPAELVRWREEIESRARDAGLDFFDVVFEMLDARDVNALAALGGFPVRYPSWRFGMEYERMQKGYAWGLSKIYELVINNDPTYAYLVRANSTMEQKLVMAHVFGHADFFKHNVWFSPTDRAMVDTMGRHATRMRELIDVHGQDRVDCLLDAALSLDNLVDPFQPLREHQSGVRRTLVGPSLAERAAQSFAAQTQPGEDRQSRAAGLPAASLPSCDVLGFLAERGHLEDWEREVLRMVRAEALYFVPQRQTQVMNEGWASFWHSRILTGGILNASEVIDFADCHAGATASQPGRVNPYKLGIELYRHAERVGLDLFRLRATHNDVSFIDAVVDEEFAERHGMFVYETNPRTGRQEIADRDWRRVKDQLLGDMAWGGVPQIDVIEEDGDGALQLRHRHLGRDLQLEQAGSTLAHISTLWGGPAHLLTEEGGEGRRIIADEEGVRVLETAEAPPSALRPDADDDDGAKRQQRA
ncbi:MAG: SpoVR family protein [Planctomycetes bacterium]|nr:SpoVR family protein [Planctomycetota bacterium]